MKALKPNDLRVERDALTKNGACWVVSEFQGYLELFPGMKSETWKRVSPKFETKKQAQDWKNKNLRVVNFLAAEARS